MAAKNHNLLISPPIRNFTLVFHENTYSLWFKDDIIKKIEDIKEPTKRKVNKLLKANCAEFLNKKDEFPKEYYEIYDEINGVGKQADEVFDVFNTLNDLFLNLITYDKIQINLNNASDKIKNTYIKSNLEIKSLEGTLEATSDMLEKHYEKSIDNINNHETKTLYIDCDILKKYEVVSKEMDDEGHNISESLYSLLERKPADMIETFKTSLELLLNDDITEYYIKFDYDGEETRIDELLSDKLGTLVKTTAVIKGLYEIKPLLKTGVYECKSCMTRYEVESVGGAKIEPSLCDNCGKRSFRFLEDDSLFYNSRKLLIDEPVEDMGNKTNPRNMLAVTMGESNYINKLNFGDRVKITGILTSYTDDKSGEIHFYLECNNIDVIDDVSINITEEDEKQIKEISEKDDLLNTLVNSSATFLDLDYELKLAILCSIVGGGSHEKGRSEIHSLIISNPGFAKTDLFEWVNSASEKCIKTSGASSTGVGLTGAIDKDPITNQNVLKAGALVLASGGICIGDEVDKLNRKAFNQLNNMLEHGFEQFNKGHIRETLYCKSTFIAGGNPIYERFSKYKSLKEQINFPPSFLSRIDNIFIYRDDPDEDILDLILDRHTGEVSQENDNNIIDGEMLKKYLYYAKHNFNPVLTKEAKDTSKIYIKSVLDYFRECEENGEEIIEFTLSRFTNSVVRVAGAIAKLHLRDEILVEDIKEVIRIKNYSYKLMGYDIENGTIEVDVVDGEVNSSKRFQYQTIFNIIFEEKEKDEGSVYISGAGVAKQYIKTRFVDMTSLSGRTCDDVIKELHDDDKLRKKKEGRYIYYDVINEDKWSESIL